MNRFSALLLQQYDKNNYKLGRMYTIYDNEDEFIRLFEWTNAERTLLEARLK